MNTYILQSNLMEIHGMSKSSQIPKHFQHLTENKYVVEILRVLYFNIFEIVSRHK